MQGGRSAVTSRARAWRREESRGEKRDERRERVQQGRRRLGGGRGGWECQPGAWLGLVYGPLVGLTVREFCFFFFFSNYEMNF
jgi:hypothetical protein